MSTIPKDFSEMRTEMVDDLETKLFGPLDPMDTNPIRLNPLQLYATGVLFPQRVFIAEMDVAGSDGDDFAPLVDGDISDTSAMATGGSETDKTDRPSDVTEPLNLANEFSPAAMGLTFRVPIGTELTCRIRTATYRSEADPERSHRQRYVREPIDEIVPVKASQFGVLEPIQVPTVRGELSFELIMREDDGSVVVSAMLVNKKTNSERSARYDACFFQVGLEVSATDGDLVFEPIDRQDGGVREDELDQLELLYRHRRSFALGHGVAADWTRNERVANEGRCSLIHTVALPKFEVQPVEPRSEHYRDHSEFNLSMGFLYSGGESADPEAAILEVLSGLADDYAAWTDDLALEVIPSHLRHVSQDNISKCRNCLERMREGISLLQADADAMTAFRLMNRAMFTQQQRSRLKPRKLGGGEEIKSVGSGMENKWRAFQLGFILMNLASVTDPEHTDRSLVELIWFPTGGGKTEAYLGLAAFSVLMRRMRNEGGGTTVLMRYTLRLLTRQQFDRASALIFALERLRRENAMGTDLGSEPITIGMWVGTSLTPNRRSDACTKLRSLKTKPYQPNPFQILHCPWCRTDLTENNFQGYRQENNHAGEKTVRFRCPEPACEFHNEHLPIVVVDDDIYDAPPTLVIGTVDKFAQLAWEDRTRNLFGGDDGASPSLIIQDELHLISGPLGTMVGLYETLIDKLCSRNGVAPKIVASTATIRRAMDQCRALYNRRAFEYPPQGNQANDSYFAQQNDKAPGRLYVGFLGSALSSHQTALVRVTGPLLQFPNQFDPSDEEIAKLLNPYGTLVWYFNTLRELGHAATLCAGDIPEYLKQLCGLENIPPEHRRMLDEPAELTSRRKAEEIPEILDQLGVDWRRGQRNPAPVDILLATNMIAVGVDINRLGLMLVNGQPKGTSEYIQATSRVGRKHPGLVVVTYTQTKNRDRSHYERFIEYHQSLYRYVEPTSVTPFSPQARSRGMRGLLVAVARHLCGFESPKDIQKPLNRNKLSDELNWILNRIEDINEDELEDARYELEGWLRDWRQHSPPAWGKMAGRVDEESLMLPFGATTDDELLKDAWPVMTSMRNVDGSSSASVLSIYPEPDQ
ncbi:helicase-related protein [uncultured Tateyamaria sp.]|uniref:helicase-related protein n=1 Tax=uncultured Tateyamaria sp. TaxID=455651 RepID=UPI00262FD9A2|nr:helicase-related protein [uncultured Tateyamaria sp.]